MKESEEKTGLKKSMVNALPVSLQQELFKSWAFHFRKQIFVELQQQELATIFQHYAEDRLPSAIYVGLEIMKALFDWSDDELIANFNFDLRVCFALGLETLGEHIVEEPVINGKRQKLLYYFENVKKEKNGNIIGSILQQDAMTDLLPALEFSCFCATFQKVELLRVYITVLKKFLDELPEKERARFHGRVNDYLGKDTNKFLSQLKNSVLEKHLTRILAMFFYFNANYHSDKIIGQLAGFKAIQKLLYKKLNRIETIDDSMLKMN